LSSSGDIATPLAARVRASDIATPLAELVRSSDAMADLRPKRKPIARGSRSSIATPLAPSSGSPVGARNYIVRTSSADERDAYEHCNNASREETSRDAYEHCNNASREETSSTGWAGSAVDRISERGDRLPARSAAGPAGLASLGRVTGDGRVADMVLQLARKGRRFA
jgi:hypothetical protein